MSWKFGGMKVAVCLALLAGASGAGALVLGGTNLGIMGYPKHRCYVPPQPPRGADEWTIRRFNTDVEVFNACARDYIENANNDVKRINEAVEDLVEESQRPY